MKKLFTLIVIALCLKTNAQTTVPGGYVYGTWTLAGSPYLIQGSIMVPNDSTLTIQAGVTVNFQGHYKFLVGGRLLAIGTQADSIFFTASNTSTGWYGIRFDTTHVTNDTSKFYYCNVQWGKANGTGVDQFGGAFMFNGFSKAIILNCLIKNITQGGAISCTNSSPFIINNNISYCSGGGISLSNNSNPNISSNLISYNNGGGISGSGNNTIIYNNIISHNTQCGINAPSGTITYNTISYNNASSSSSQAGGISCGGMGTTIISHNIISYNSCPGCDGGAIFCYIGNPIISDNIISNNSGTNGAGISIQGGSPPSCCNPTISNNVIVNNTAIDHFTSNAASGGGIFCASGNPLLVNNTIANNSAKKGGGLYYTATSNPSVFNSIIYGNKDAMGNTQVYINDEPSDPNFYYCDVEGGSATFNMNGNFYSGNYSNNINANPLFISPTADTGINYNGVTANWSLQSVSPCINTGEPTGSYPGTYLTTDIAGNPRIYGSNIDMGAYELQSLAGISQYLNLNTQISIYPNPNNGSFVIEPQNTLYNVHCTVYDVNGKAVLTKTINGKTNIDACGLNEGVYNIGLQSNEGVVNKRLVIVR